MRTSSRKGSAVVAVLDGITLIGVAAVVIDVGYARTVQHKLQSSADAGAHAGVGYLDGTEEGLENAKARAAELANENASHDLSLSLANGRELTADDVLSGYWQGGAFVQSDDPEEVDALQVSMRAPSLATSFAKIAFGRDTMSARSRSIGLRPPPEPPGEVRCVLPIAVPLCELQRYPADTLASITFEFTSARADNAGWASLVTNPNASSVRAQIRDCASEGAATVGDEVHLNNGQISSGLQELATAISESETTWDTEALGALPDRMSRSAITASRYGRTFEGPIMVFDEEGQTCSDINFVQSYPLVGFAWAAVYDVSTSGSDKDLRVRLNNTATMEYGTRGGGSVDGGVIYQPPLRVVN